MEPKEAAAPGRLRALWHRLRYGVRTASPSDLVGPNRADIELRVEFLRLHAGGLPESEQRQTPYFAFLKSQEAWSASDAEDRLQRFLELHASIRKHGYLGGEHASEHIIVVRRQSPFQTVVPPKTDGRPGRMVEEDHALKAGGHRLAVLLHLGYRSISYRLVDDPSFTPPDYTTYLAQLNS